MTENGLVEILKADSEQGPLLPPVARRRLQRLQAQVDGATQVAQAAVNAHQALREAYEQAFRASCEDYGIEVPDGPHDVDINWITGAVRFAPKAMM